ncbi:hypothetical protein MTO96_042796 [Rhipicephalus appendiculatus]
MVYSQNAYQDSIAPLWQMPSDNNTALVLSQCPTDMPSPLQYCQLAPPAGTRCAHHCVLPIIVPENC